MAAWSVEEQTIPTAPLHVKSIVLRVDEAASHIMIMELRVDEDPPVIGYVLKFNRNGAFIEAVQVDDPNYVPPPPGTQSASAHSKSKSKRDD